MIDLTENYKWLATQYRETNVSDLISEINQVVQDKQVNVLVQFTDKFSIETATGIWLDYIGYRLNIPNRPALPVDPTEYFGFEDSEGSGFDQEAFYNDSDSIQIDDDDFRAFLKVRVRQLITNCTSEDIRSALLLFFDDVMITDNQDMTMTITYTTTKAFEVVKSVVENGILIKPAAVRVDQQIVFDDYFGFDDSGGTGFDQAPFVYEV